jgi:hypothetical protein
LKPGLATAGWPELGSCANRDTFEGGAMSYDDRISRLTKADIDKLQAHLD